MQDIWWTYWDGGMECVLHRESRWKAVRFPEANGANWWRILPCSGKPDSTFFLRKFATLDQAKEYILSLFGPRQDSPGPKRRA